MHAVSLNVLAIFHFLSSIVLVACDGYVCNSVYGKPTYSDCLDLTYKLFDGWPGTLGDTHIHLYALRNEPLPEWDRPERWQSRVWLPKFTRKGQFSFLQ